MKEQLLKGIRCVSRWTRPASDTERGIGKKRMPVAARIAGCLLLIGVFLPAALCVAAEQDPREAAIIADLAGGTDIAVIIQNAVAAGLTVVRAVEVLVTANSADSGRVVYMAITAHFLASDVVCGAANAVQRMNPSDAALLTQLAMVGSVARQADASQTEVNTGLTCGSISPAVIANANALAAASPPPVYGYTVPPGFTRPPTAGIGGVFGRGAGGGLIGGSGLGKPPTTPASPTHPTHP